MIDVHRAALYSNDQSDRWLMQTVLEHSSSHPAREVAAAWVGAYDSAWPSAPRRRKHWCSPTLLTTRQQP